MLWSTSEAKPYPGWSALREKVEKIIREYFEWPTESRKTTFLHARLIAESKSGDAIEDEEVEVRLDPPLPCEGDGSKCKWDNPHELLGGLEENPGVSGKDGEVAIRHICSTCGHYRRTLIRDQDAGSLDEWRETTEYFSPDDDALEWIETIRARDEKQRANDTTRRLVLETLDDNIGAQCCQHIIVFTDREDEDALLKSTIEEIHTRPDLARRLLAVRLATRERTIASTKDFWLGALSGLQTAVEQEVRKHGDPWPATLLQIEKTMQTEEHARLTVLRTAEQLERQIVLVVENAQTLFESDVIDQDFGYVLRHTLQTQPGIMMLFCTTAHECKAADNARQ